MNTQTPKDFFLHLGAIVALYVSVGALINLSFSVINYYFPDALAGYFYGNAVATPISILVVMVPILYVLEWFINRDAARMPEKKNIWIRKWRIYITLFSAAVLFAGDLIVLINTYLSGEITSRLVYKVIAILIIAAVVGKYYFYSLYENFKWSALARKIHPWVGIVLVVAAIVSGFIAVGSPAKQRGLRFDNQRLSDLSNIQWQVISYWQQKGMLPAKLTDLEDKLSGSTIPKDPETRAVYEYSKSAPLTFQICATFSYPTQDTEGRGEFGYGGGSVYPSYDMSYPYPGGGIDENWAHGAGRTCFDRTIDPDKYPVTPKPLTN
jgi:uncharacterized membrane protein